MGEPDSMAEQNYGDAGAAVLLGTQNVLAELLGSFSVSEEFLGTWRTEQQEYLHQFPGGFDIKFGYTRFMTPVIPGVLPQAQLAPTAVPTPVLAAPHPRALARVAKALGFDPK